MSEIIEVQEPAGGAVAVVPHSGLQMPVVDPRQLVQRVQAIQHAMESVMVREVHYGVIPGTDKPTLYKPGSEILLTMFGVAVQVDVENLSVTGEVHYRVRATGISQSTGNIVGFGIGECTTAEEKYAWTYCNSSAEWDACDPTRRREKAKKNGSTYRQIRANPYDKANTILKMAKKRAQIDLCLTALACSDMFEQDLEDVDLETGELAPRGSKPSTRAPARRAQGGAVLNDSQVRILQRALDNRSVSAEALCKKIGVSALADIKASEFNACQDWISSQGNAS